MPSSTKISRILTYVVGLVIVIACGVMLMSVRRAGHTAAAIGLARDGSEATPSAPNWSDVMVKTSAGTEHLVQTEPVAMIVSSTCIHCHKMLAAMARANAGPHLTIVTIQGLVAGDSLLKAAGLKGTVAAPSPDVDAWIRQTGVQSVPTFLWFDDSGHIKAAALGELSDSAVAVWAGRTK